MSVPPQNVISKKLTLTCHGHENGIVSKPPMTLRLAPPGGRGGMFGTSGPGGGRRPPPLPAPLSPLVPGTNGSMRGTPHGSELAGKKTGFDVGLQTTRTIGHFTIGVTLDTDRGKYNTTCVMIIGSQNRTVRGNNMTESSMRQYWNTSIISYCFL